MRVIVCGGRRYNDRRELDVFLDRFHADTPISLLRHGAATGADTLAGDWAIRNNITVESMPANWRLYGKAAGYIRNKAMLDRGVDAVIAFPGSYGTANMMRIAREAGVPVIEPQETSSNDK